jgi:hypothetical protein
MKSFVRGYTPNHMNKKRALISGVACIAAVMMLVFAGCIKEDYPVRLILPVVTTTAASAVSSTSVTSGGNVVSDGGFDVTARGICWGNKINPSLADTLDRFSSNGTGTGQFSVTIDTLTAGKDYHIRAYATNKEGTAYGPDITFSTPE